MKYIITENRLNQLIFNYLESQDWYDWDIGDGEFNVAEGEYGRDLIRLRIQYSSTVPDHEFNVIYISDELVTKISNLFGIGIQESISSIISWFNVKYDKNLTKDDFEWMDHDEEYDIDDEIDN
jgi:hypothetical protein